MTWRSKHPSLWAGAIGGVLCLQVAAAQSVDDLLRAGAEHLEELQAQQAEIDRIFAVTEDLFEEYQAVQRDIEINEIFVDSLQAEVDVQDLELRTLYRAIDEVGEIERQILPLMQRMITGLEKFIEVDLPFQLEERRERVERLRGYLVSPNIDTSQKFRVVFEAWLDEMDGYGATGDAYFDVIQLADGTRREVEILRVGRIALLYVTPDGTRAGAWDNRIRRWVDLDPSMVGEIQVGLETYRTETSSTLFDVPVEPPEVN